MFTSVMLREFLLKHKVPVSNRGFYSPAAGEITIDFGKGPILGARISKSGTHVLLLHQSTDAIIKRFDIADPKCFDYLLEELVAQEQYTELTIEDFEKFKPK